MQIPENKVTGRRCFWMAVLLCFSPLAGVLYLDLPLERYLEFPPRTRYIVHAPFSWPVFLVLLSFITAVCSPVLIRLINYRNKQKRSCRTAYPFPWWGGLGMILVILSWVLAWNRFPVFAPLQRYTFTPLWIGYILAVSGISCRRMGICLMLSQPLFFLVLFPSSTIFWWYFEYLNRFAQNWYYLGGGDISAAEYVVHASICFSTVLPAVLATCELLWTFPRLTGAFEGWHPLLFPGRKEGVGWLLLSGAVFSLAFLVVLPDYLFPLVWISPLLVMVGMQLINGQRTVFTGVQEGDWRSVILPAMAALVCGFFWEMWNWKSLAHWEYSVPFVDRYRIFAMPLPGYAGYLPFGLECVMAASLIHALLPAAGYDRIF